MTLRRRVALQSVLCYEVRDGTFLVRSETHPSPQSGSREAIDLDRYRNRTKNFRAFFPLKSTP